MNKVNIIQRETSDIIKTTVDKAVDMVKVTYGPSSAKVIISKMTHAMAVDDGVQIMRDLEFNDPNENAVLRIMREVAVRTNDRAGDGTTSSMIMLQAIMKAAYERPTVPAYEIVKELKVAVEEAKKQLEDSATPIDKKEQLQKVARISFDDQAIADLIADTAYKMGKDGLVKIDRSSDMETKVEMVDGIKINRGYVSPYMVTHPQTMEGIIDKPYILLTDYRLLNAGDVTPIMDKLLSKKINSLVIVCDTVESDALATLIVNKQRGIFNAIAVSLPTGDKQVTLEDLATILGATVYSEKKGSRLENMELADLGRAGKFIANSKETLIMKPKGKKEEMEKVITDLTKASEAEEDDKNKKVLKDRISTFSNKVAVIKVGAKTDNEERALMYKVEDAVNAVQMAFKGGVVCGAGLALSRLVTSSEILNEALKAPFKQLKMNMGITTHRELKNDEAINAINGKIGKYMDIGVVDPAQVLIAGLESAVSIASVLLTTKGMIVEVPPTPKE
jgi:chaperonin GroEL